MEYIGVISYNLLTNLLLTSWDIQVTPNRNPTYNDGTHFNDILVVTIG